MVFESGDADRLAALSALGLGPGAKARDIISAYRRLARRNHPDLAPGQPGTGQRFDLDQEGKRSPQRNEIAELRSSQP